MIAYLGDNLIGSVFNGNSNIILIPSLNTTPLTIDYLITGAGGEAFSGGGGAGQFVTGSTILSDGSYPIIAGKITTGTTTNLQISGSSSTFNGITAKGGGNGGAINANVALAKGWNGASGGGASRTIGAVGGAGSPQFNGASADLGRAGGGGGAGGAGSNNFGTAGGIGKQWLDGIYYCGGGGAEFAGGGGLGCSPAAGGGGNWNEGPSGPGMVRIRYEGVPKATGGTITQSGGYTYHTYLGTSTDTISSFTYYSL